MNELFKRFKWMLVLVGSLLLSAGILVFVIAIVNPGIISLIISIVIAACLFASGSITIVASFFSRKRELFSPVHGYAALLIGLGIILCMEPGLLSYLLVRYVAVSLIVVGAVSFARGIFAVVWKDKTTWIVTLFVAAVVGIALGVLILVFSLEDLMLTIIYIGVGVTLAVVGVIQIIAGVKLLNKN